MTWVGGVLKQFFCGTQNFTFDLSKLLCAYALVQKIFFSTPELPQKQAGVIVGKQESQGFLDFAGFEQDARVVHVFGENAVEEICHRDICETDFALDGAFGQ
jgi:hypothetical protein